mgnify:CR=1 FL=1
MTFICRKTKLNSSELIITDSIRKKLNIKPGSSVIFNRQPTLSKSSIFTKVTVKSVKYYTNPSIANTKLEYWIGQKKYEQHKIVFPIYTMQSYDPLDMYDMYNYFTYNPQNCIDRNIRIYINVYGFHYLSQKLPLELVHKILIFNMGK